MSGVEYLPASVPWDGADREALVRYLDGQSRIRAAYEVGIRYAPRADGSRKSSDKLWLELSGRMPAYVAHRALSAGLYRELLWPGERRGVSWNFVTRTRAREAGAAAGVLWRASSPPAVGLDPLAFSLRWEPLEPPPGFAADVSALLQGVGACPRRVPDERGPAQGRRRVRLVSPPLCRLDGPGWARPDVRRPDCARVAPPGAVRRRHRAAVPADSQPCHAGLPAQRRGTRLLMTLEMRALCERCEAPLAAGGEAVICSYECTFCVACGDALDHVCPNCSGELVARPKRVTEA